MNKGANGKRPRTDYPPFPFETLKRLYVTRFGGYSPDLRAHQIGVNEEALRRKTDLVPFIDRVAIGVLGKGRPRPIFMDDLYEVFPIDQSLPDAAQKSILGEAVLSDEVDMERRPFDSLRGGELILLSCALTRPFDESRAWRWELLDDALRELQILDA